MVQKFLHFSWKAKWLSFFLLITFQSLSGFSQDRIITGLVSDSQGALPGVSVMVKGTKVGVSTGVDGKYTLKASTGAVLIFTSIGYEVRQVTVGANSVINMTLSASNKELEEVVVVGYNTMKKGDVTGALTRVGQKEIEQMPVQNALQAMQGRAAGVDITSNSRPGEMGSIRIRGNRSLLAGNDPLYVVDGIPLAAGGIESINPHDIEAIDVLKDASATAVYGSRAANGVVLVTTKKGKSGATQVTYNLTTNFETINDLVDNFNSGEYAEYRREAYRNAKDAKYTLLYPNPKQDKAILGTDPNAWANIKKGYTWIDEENEIPAMRATTAEEAAKWGVSEVPVYDGSKIPTTNWTDYVNQTGITQDHTLGVSSGTDKLRGYFSGGYLSQNGTSKGQSYKRYNAKASLDFKPTNWLSLGGSFTTTWSVQNYGYSGTGSRDAKSIYAAAKGMLPFAVPYDENGEYIFQPGADIGILNPILEDDYVTNERTTLRALGSFYTEIQLLKGLKYRMNFGPDFRNYRNGEFQDKLSILRSAGAATSTNYARLRQSQNFAWTLDNLIYYDKTFNDVHKLGITLLQSMMSNRTEGSDMTATNLPYSSQKWYNLSSTSRGALDGWGSNYSKNTILSYMARVNYSLSDKYMVTVSSRWDAASVLAAGNKWDFFPAASIGWKMEEESFIKNISWINQLKPRFGVGVTGNSSVDPYSTAGGLTQMPIVFGSQVAIGYVPSDAKAAEPVPMPNKKLKWEKTTQWNLGLDYGFLKNRVRGYMDFYISNTNDLLLNRTISSLTGYTKIYDNIGKTQNKGFDFTLSTTNIRTKDFQWNTDISLSLSKDKIVELYAGKNDAPELTFFIGEPLFVYYDYKKTGIWQTADAAEMKKFNDNGGTYKAGDIRVEDVNGDYKIDPNNDRQVLGNKFPNWTSGLTNTLNYKNWELSFFVYARWGSLIEGGAADMQGRFASRKVDYWTVDNPTNAYPRADYSNGGQPIHYSAMNYQDGSFIKVKNISVGYTLPSSYLKAVHMSNFKLYGQVLNPYLYTKNGIIDPDINSSISSRSFVLGLNASF